MRHMLDHAREARDLMAGRTRADLDSDRLLNLGVVRLLEVVGEAARRVPPNVRALHSNIEWKGVVGLRDRLIHGYDEVDFDRVWRIACDDLYPLIEALEAILSVPERPE